MDDKFSSTGQGENLYPRLFDVPFMERARAANFHQEPYRIATIGSLSIGSTEFFNQAESLSSVIFFQFHKGDVQRW